jgi:sialidase-1
MAPFFATAMFTLVTLACTTPGFSQVSQWVEGFDRVEFHHNANHTPTSRDFRGTARGYLTAGWWAPGQLAQNHVSWRTAAVPAKQTTTFSFIAATSVLPSEFSRGPQARLSINGRHALTFTLGCIRDFTWKEGAFQLKYVSKRVEYPYFGSHRQGELNGNSGLFQFTVPAEVVEAGQPAVLKVEIVPFAGWDGGWFMIKERRDTLHQSIENLQGEIEALRHDMATVNQQTHILATQIYEQLVDRGRFTHDVIYTSGFRHLHPADLIPLQNGELLITTREASEHYAQDGDVIVLRSKDGGLTWGDRRVMAGLKNVDEREGCGVQLRDGTIIVGIYYNNLYNPDGSYIFGANKHLNEPDKHYLGTYLITSTDNGISWSEPRYLDTTGMPFRNVEGPTDAPIEMPDGSVLMAVIGYNIAGDEKNRSSVMLRSADQGKTWRYLSTIAGDPGGKHGGFLEPGLLRTKTGRLIVGLRNHGADHAIYMTHSDDDGKTWAPVQKTAMHGHPVDLIQLADGRIMASYGVRPAIHARPGGIRATFSSDNGGTWDTQTEVQIRKDFINWDVGYPESLQLPDGRVLTVYYYNLFNKYFIGGTYWKP